jgi:3-hydroxyisobutyrate dehydrogenase-like beta-hydroxyacid dehydrogenase
MVLRAVGLLSPGDMGHVVGEVLVNHGMPVLTCLRGRSERTRALAQRAKIEAADSYEELVRRVDLILSILVPAEAGKAAHLVSGALRKTGEKLIYVDCNAVSPATVKSIGKVIEGAGSRFVDAGIIGPPPRQKGTTRFYASGEDAEYFAGLRDYGLDVRVVGPETGQASGLKMVYAALTKGLTALSTELLVAAHQMGLYRDLVEEFRISQAQQYDRMERWIPSMPPKARRWVGEMEEIAKTFQDLALTPNIYQGAAEVYRRVGQNPLADETPETRDKGRSLEEVVEALVPSLFKSTR